MSRTVQTPTDEAEVIIAATASAADQALVERLRAIASPDTDHGECFEPLRPVIFELVFWLAVAASLWVAAFAYAIYS